jgi:hypothetical protein
MTSADEPVVETLSAVIRVLQVGPKPVSLSAARQLDAVDGAVIKAFGRVRIEAKPTEGLIEVIGSLNGVLAKSSAYAQKVECPGYHPSSSYSRGYGLPQEACARHRDVSAVAAAGHHEWVKYTPSHQVYEAWQELPLIVLAGLR